MKNMLYCRVYPLLNDILNSVSLKTTSNNFDVVFGAIKSPPLEYKLKNKENGGE